MMDFVRNKHWPLDIRSCMVQVFRVVVKTMGWLLPVLHSILLPLGSSEYLVVPSRVVRMLAAD